MKKTNRVFITGLGPVTSIGIGRKQFWANATQGKSSFADITRFDTDDYPELKNIRVSEILNFDPGDYVTAKEASRMDRIMHFALAGGLLALEDSGLNMKKIKPGRSAVIMGTAIGGVDSFYKGIRMYHSEDRKKISPAIVPMILPGLVAGQLALTLGITGSNRVISSACTSATHALGDACQMIKNDLADVVFAGGAEASINPMAMFGFWKAKALSHSPAPKPFDVSRDGFVMGEGAGILILESEAHAIKRNATVYAEVVGYGASADAFHITAPRSDGSLSALAIKQALEQAGVQPEEMGYINAHGTGTFFGDRAEYLAIQKVFKKNVSKIPVSSTKSLIGHSQGACGGIEAIVCALTLSTQKIHPTQNFNQSDPECKLNLVTKLDAPLKKKHVLSINTGFGGNNATLVFKKS